jgi:serine protease
MSQARALGVGATLTVSLAVFLVTDARTQPSALSVPRPLGPAGVRQLLERKAERRIVEGDVIVKLRSTAAAAAAPGALSPRARLGPATRQLPGGFTLHRVLPPPSATAAMPRTRKQLRQDTVDLVRELGRDPTVEYAQPNFVHELAQPPSNDPLFPRQWNLLDFGSAPGRSPGGISAVRSWGQLPTGAPVVVAVIDTGIVAGHEDFQGSPRLVAGYDMVGDTWRANDGDGRDANPEDPGDAVGQGDCGYPHPPLPNSWHGTHVAGIVGLANHDNGVGMAALNPAVRVQPVRVLGRCGGDTVDINDAIRWAAGLPVPDAPPNPTPAKVLNLSFRAFAPCSESPSTQAAIDDVVAAGVTVVAAAGNDGVDVKGVFPAGCTGVIAVAASDARGRLVRRYSNHGAGITLMAPGGDVDRDDNRDNHPDGIVSAIRGGYDSYNGTSMAAPHVAGVAALLIGRDPSLTPAQVQARLVETAIPRTSQHCPRPCGRGLLSAAAVTNLEAPGSVTVKVGETAQVRLVVTEGTRHVAGRTVTLSTHDPSTATVTSTSATSDSNGNASATVKGEKEGQTSLKGQVDDATTQTRVTVEPVKVPGLAWPGAILLAAVMRLALRRRRAPGART